MRLCVRSSSYSDSFVSRMSQKRAPSVPCRRIRRQPADPHRVVGEARAADSSTGRAPVPLPKGVQEHRHRADVHRVVRPQALARDPRSSAAPCGCSARPRTSTDSASRRSPQTQLFVAAATYSMRSLMGQSGSSAVLARFSMPRVQVPDDDVGTDHALAVESQHDPQHAVGARVLRSHVQDSSCVSNIRVYADVNDCR